MNTIYKTKWEDKAEDDLVQLPSETSLKIYNRVESYLAQSPKELGKALVGKYSGLYRYRYGDYRIIYENEFLDITLLCLIIYHFTHFIWQSIDACKEWRLRLTGTNELFMKNDIAKESSEDYALNPLQSSLLNWLWKRTKITADDYCTTSTNVLNAMTEESNRAISLKPTLESDALLNITNIHKAINDSRTLVSLKRFEDFHKCFCCSQRWRWLVIEFGTPVCLALFAIYQICQSYLLGWLNFPCL